VFVEGDAYDIATQSLDLTGEDGDLYFAGSRITVMTLEFVLNCGLIEFHFFVSFFLILQTGKLETLPLSDTTSAY
jgi:hypothetical protein